MSGLIKTGGSAFPIPVAQRGDYGTTHSDHKGMTLRDYFAAKAMQGLLDSAIEWFPTGKNADASSLDIFADISGDAYAIADAMLKARET